MTSEPSQNQSPQGQPHGKDEALTAYFSINNIPDTRENRDDYGRYMDCEANGSWVFNGERMRIARKNASAGNVGGAPAGQLFDAGDAKLQTGDEPLDGTIFDNMPDEEQPSAAQPARADALNGGLENAIANGGTSVGGSDDDFEHIKAEEKRIYDDEFVAKGKAFPNLRAKRDFAIQKAAELDILIKHYAERTKDDRDLLYLKGDYENSAVTLLQDIEKEENAKAEKVRKTTERNNAPAPVYIESDKHKWVPAVALAGMLGCIAVVGYVLNTSKDNENAQVNAPAPVTAPVAPAPARDREITVVPAPANDYITREEFSRAYAQMGTVIGKELGSKLDETNKVLGQMLAYQQGASKVAEPEPTPEPAPILAAEPVAAPVLDVSPAPVPAPRTAYQVLTEKFFTLIGKIGTGAGQIEAEQYLRSIKQADGETRKNEWTGRAVEVLGQRLDEREKHEEIRNRYDGE